MKASKILRQNRYLVHLSTAKFYKSPIIVRQNSTAWNFLLVATHKRWFLLFFFCLFVFQDSDSSVDAITPLSPPCLSPMSSSPLVSPPSSSKKRKVGRPRKHTDNHSNNLTETLVSKTPRVPSKNNLVGLIISSKPSHQSSRLKCDKNSVNGDKCSKQTPLTHSHDSSLLHKSSSSSKFSPTFMNSLDEDYKPNKIRPKLKAEAKVFTAFLDRVVSNFRGHQGSFCR